MCNTKGMVIVTLAFIHTCFRVCSVVQVNQDNQHLLNNELLTPKSSGFSDEDFYEWFRGLVDGEGCFIIQSRNNNYFLFKFVVYMHRDDAPMLKYIANRLGVGNVNVREDFADFSVTSKKDLLTIINLFKITYIIDKFIIIINLIKLVLIIKKIFLIYSWKYKVLVLLINFIHLWFIFYLLSIYKKSFYTFWFSPVFEK